MAQQVEIERRRPFRAEDIAARFNEQGGCCALCPKELVFAGQPLKPGQSYFVADHRTPRALGGKTVRENLDLICEGCNAGKTYGRRGDLASIAKAKRIERKADPVTRPRSRRPLKGRPFRKDLTRGFDGQVRPRR